MRSPRVVLAFFLVAACAGDPARPAVDIERSPSDRADQDLATELRPLRCAAAGEDASGECARAPTEYCAAEPLRSQLDRGLGLRRLFFRDEEQRCVAVDGARVALLAIDRLAVVTFITPNANSADRYSHVDARLSDDDAIGSGASTFILAPGNHEIVLDDPCTTIGCSGARGSSGNIYALIDPIDPGATRRVGAAVVDPTLGLTVKHVYFVVEGDGPLAIVSDESSDALRGAQIFDVGPDGVGRFAFRNADASRIAIQAVPGRRYGVLLYVAGRYDFSIVAARDEDVSP